MSTNGFCTAGYAPAAGLPLGASLGACLGAAD
jgi:hypothetical protein